MSVCDNCKCYSCALQLEFTKCHKGCAVCELDAITQANEVLHTECEDYVEVI